MQNVGFLMTRLNYVVFAIHIVVCHCKGVQRRIVLMVILFELSKVFCVFFAFLLLYVT